MKKFVSEIKIENGDNVAELLGVFDENLILISKETKTTCFLENNSIKIEGEKQDVENAKVVLEKLLEVIRLNERVDKNKVTYCLELSKNGLVDEIVNVSKDVVAVTTRGKQIKCKTVGQKTYVDGIRNNTVVFGVGPAGTGKTYLAVALAVAEYKQKKVEKIILTRPAVEAGEKLGFLPGDLQNKVDPYLRPLYDALQEMFGLETYQNLISKGTIEIAPLAYMRGRTLSNSFIILDEAQNTTNEQMKMFLTRMGEGSKMVITGDVTQIDLPSGKQSGLKTAIKILKDIKGLKVINLTSKDVVRHPLVSKIIEAYSKSEQED